MRMPFGKHLGMEVCDLPDGYLYWLTWNADIHDRWLRHEIDCEYERRFCEQPPHHEGSSSDNGWKQNNQRRKQYLGGSNASALRPMTGDQKALLAQVVEAGYRQLALKTHPDHGGSDEAMRKLNLLMEQVRKALK